MLCKNDMHILLLFFSFPSMNTVLTFLMRFLNQILKSFQYSGNSGCPVLFVT